MKIKRFFNEMFDFFYSHDFDVKSKKEATKNLMHKLERKRKHLKKEIQKSKSKQQQELLLEYLKLTKIQLKKAQNYLKELKQMP